MASPSIAGSAITEGSGTASPVAINLPASISAGDLLIAIISLGTNTSAAFPAGWNELENDIPDVDTVIIGWREADGGEGSTFDLTVGASAKAAAVVYRITGAEDPDTQPPEITTAATGASDQIDPPSISPTGGSKDYLFLAVGIAATAAAAFGSWPSGYTEGQADADSTGGVSSSRAAVYAAGRKLTASSEDPGAIAIGAGRTWVAYTIAVHPPSGGGGTTVSPDPVALAASAVAPARLLALGQTPVALAGGVAAPARALALAAAPVSAAASAPASTESLDPGAGQGAATGSVVAPALALSAAQAAATAALSVPASVAALAPSVGQGQATGAVAAPTLALSAAVGSAVSAALSVVTPSTDGSTTVLPAAITVAAAVAAPALSLGLTQAPTAAALAVAAPAYTLALGAAAAAAAGSAAAPSLTLALAAAPAVATFTVPALTSPAPAAAKGYYYSRLLSIASGRG